MPSKFIFTKKEKLLISDMKTRYGISINFNRYVNHTNKMTNYVLFSSEMYAKHKNFNSTKVAGLWKKVNADAKKFYSKMAAKIYNKPITRRKKENAGPGWVKQNKKKTEHLFKYETVSSFSTNLVEKTIDGIIYMVDCYDNIIDMEEEKDCGFINKKAQAIILQDGENIDYLEPLDGETTFERILRIRGRKAVVRFKNKEKNKNIKKDEYECIENNIFQLKQHYIHVEDLPKIVGDDEKETTMEKLVYDCFENKKNNISQKNNVFKENNLSPKINVFEENNLSPKNNLYQQNDNKLPLKLEDKINESDYYDISENDEYKLFYNQLLGSDNADSELEEYN